MKKVAIWIFLAGGSLIISARAEAPAAPDLGACLAAALESNPGLEAATMRTEAARAALEKANAGLMPSIYANGTYSMTDNPTQAFMMQLNQRRLNMADPGFNPNQPGEEENVRLSLGGRWTLTDGGQRTSAIQAADLGSQSMAAQESAARNALAHEVTRAYYAALQARAFVAVQADTVKSIEESLRIARERLSAGSAARSDVLNLEVRLAEAREGLIRSENTTAIARVALNTAIGRDLVPESGPAPCAMNVEDMKEDAAATGANRPELAAARLGRQALASAEDAARAQYAPSLSTFASYDWDNAHFHGEYENSYVFGVAVDWELFSFGRRGGAVAEARARRMEAEAQERALSQAVRLDIAQADAEARDARARYDVSGKGLESADEALRITRERYQQGSADISELLNAETALASARLRREGARYEFFTARSNQARARGAAEGAFSTIKNAGASPDASAQPEK